MGHRRMKRRAVWIFLLGVLVGIALSVLYKHFVTDQIMDRGGMENPDFAYPLDGDRTYVDNSALWPVLEGTWKSTDGRWVTKCLYSTERAMPTSTPMAGGHRRGERHRPHGGRRDGFRVAAAFYLSPAGQGFLYGASNGYPHAQESGYSGSRQDR